MALGAALFVPQTSERESDQPNPIQSRLEYASFYAHEAAKRNLLTIVWDDGGRFRLYDRHSLDWDYSNIATAIIEATNP